MKQNKKVIGLTGTIASGKSTVARYFLEKYEIPVIDADKVGHDILKDETVKAQIVESFGRDILDETGEIMRSKLGPLVFAEQEKRQRLNEITHPAICGKIREWLQERKEESAAPFILVEAIELLRSELAEVVDEVWVVYAEPKVRQQRMVEERGLTADAAVDRIESQWDDKQYMEKADKIINGNGTVTDLYRQCDEIFGKWRVE